MQKVGDAMMATTQRYSHRNGETEPPTEEGFYWICFDDSRYPSAWEIVRVFLDGDAPKDVTRFIVFLMGNEDYASTVEYDNAYRWWGPVSPPWGDE
jgi:hypothetical protein